MKIIFVCVGVCVCVYVCYYMDGAILNGFG